MLPKLNLEHTLEQSFQIRAAEEQIKHASREDLEQMCLDLMRQSSGHQNAVRSLLRGF
jgi:FtsZ-binding cell division protein ZapB